MTNETLIKLLESRVVIYEKAANMNKEQGLEQAATTAQALADEVKQILSYMKE